MKSSPAFCLNVKRNQTAGLKLVCTVTFKAPSGCNPPMKRKTTMFINQLPTQTGAIGYVREERQRSEFFRCQSHTRGEDSLLTLSSSPLSEFMTWTCGKWFSCYSCSDLIYAGTRQEIFFYRVQETGRFGNNLAGAVHLF